MIEKILPATAVCAEAFEDRPRGALFATEAASIAQAIAPRRREFTTARVCARTALCQLGLPPSEIPRGRRGVPQWPAGVVGSITHCDGYRGAAVARAADVAGIGIDVEPNKPLPPGVLQRIASATESTRVDELAALAPRVNWDRLLFSVKEATYKAWSSPLDRWLSFTDAVVDLYAAYDQFTVDVLVSGETASGSGSAHKQLNGRWLAAGGLLATAVTVMP